MENIKKTLCAALAVLMISASFAFASCGTEDKTNTTAAEGTRVEVKTDAHGIAVTDADGKSVTEIVGGASTGKNTPGGQNSDDRSGTSDGNVSVQSAKDAPQFVLSTVKSEYAAGDAVTVTVSLKKAPLTACFDFYVKSDGAHYSEVSTASISDMQIAADGAEEICRIMGMVATTLDIDNSQIADVTFSIPADAKSGDVITFTGLTKDFDVGRDSSGAKTDSVTAKMTDPVLKITVK